MSGVTKEIFDHLVDLAALELTEQEAEYLREEMNQQLKAIRELEAIPLMNSVKITSHGISYSEEESLSLREDVVAISSCVKELMAQFPHFEGGYIIVPDIEHITLE